MEREKVRRWYISPACDCGEGIETESSPGGEWVEVRDFDRLVAERDRLTALCEAQAKEIAAWRRAVNLGYIARKWRGLTELDEQAQSSIDAIDAAVAATDALTQRGGGESR